MVEAIGMKKQDRLAEYSRDRLERMAQRISDSRDPDVIASILRSELRNLIHDYGLRADGEEVRG